MSIAAIFRRGIDRMVGGRGEHSITVPVMDGALKPNDGLERASSVAMIDGADNLLSVDGRILCSGGDRVFAVSRGGSVDTLFDAGGPVSCLAADGDGTLAVGIDGTGIRIRGGRHDGLLVERAGAGALSCPTDAVFLDRDTLAVANGSSRFRAAEWRHDLLHHGRTGRVVLIDLVKGSAREIAGNLAFPAGLCIDRDDASAVLVSEAWAHRVIRVRTSGGGAGEVLADLPAYPGRLVASAEGGYWLACFSVRSQLQEFILREDRYRRRMIAEVDPDFWIAPALSSGKSFKEPLQAGGVIRLGVHKPWAPTRSYGLVIRLGPDFQPAWSLHSRADGVRHGVTSLVETEGRLFVASKGRGEIVSVGYTALSEPDGSVTAGDTP